MISQLIQKIQKTKAPICVGLDPMLGYIPNHIVQRAFKDSARPWKELPRLYGSLTKKLLITLMI
mgnify:CR=1 FL=1